VPVPGLAKVILPPLAFACPMKSGIERTGETFGTTTQVGYWTTRLIGTKSATGS
jgi:hypothetical protein